MARKSVVVGLGNPTLTDDGVGLLAVKKIEEDLKGGLSNFEFKLNYSGGFDLLFDLEDFDRAFIVDAVFSGREKPGTVIEFGLEDIDEIAQPRIVDSHGLNLPTVIACGKKSGCKMPEEVIIYGIEGLNYQDFSEELSEPLQKEFGNVCEEIKPRILKAN